MNCCLSGHTSPKDSAHERDNQEIEQTTIPLICLNKYSLSVVENKTNQTAIAFYQTELSTPTYILPFRTSSSSLIFPSPAFTSSAQHYRFSVPHFAKHSSTLIAIFDGMAFRTFSMSSPAILCPKVRAITPSLKENSCSATRLTANSSDVNAAVKFAGSHSGFTCVWNDPAG